MFVLGDIVMYASSGACKIVAEETKEFFGSAEECFILEPVFGNKMKIYVPKSNGILTAKMRKPLEKPEVMSLIKNLPEKGEEYPPIDSIRKQKYAEIIASGDQKKILAVIKAIYDKKTEQIENKKKLHQCDEMILREAEKIIFDEFALALGIEHNEVHDYIVANKN